jgi:hypothetical protein
MTGVGRTEKDSDASDCDLTELLLRHLITRTEENHEKQQSGKPLQDLRFSQRRL